MRNERGSALLVVAGIIVVLSVIVDTVMVNYDSNMKTLEAFSGKRQAFYLSEGVRALATVLLEGYLMNNASPSETEMGEHLDEALAPLIPAPYRVSPIDVRIIKTTPSAVITSGPFKGMNGPITDLLLKFNVLAPSTIFGGDLVEPLEVRLSVAYISMFQFMAFFDIDRATIGTGPEMVMSGRLHSNGDLCVGGSSGYQNFLKVTVGRRLMNRADSRCGGGSGSNRARIAVNPNNFTGALDITNAYDNGCTNCNGTGLSWEAFALARWREQALDMAHGVQILKLPGAGEGGVQSSRAGTGGTAVNNGTNLRFIVDPVLPTDSPSVRSYKYAHNADIRIINGVWYIKDPLNPMLWPGLPVWSDHPGSHEVDGVFVGQDDIRVRWESTRPWPAAPGTPTGYSYYEYDAVNETIFDNGTQGVISYGNLINTGASAIQQSPAHWVNGGTSSFCDATLGETLSCSGGCGLINVNTGLSCNGPGAPYIGRDPGYATKILNATRGGFRNGHIYVNSPGSSSDRQRRSRILPINFDVARLQTALQNSGPGELGSYFGVTGYKGAPFNGVIYVSSTWPGANNGYGGGGPSEWPWVGGTDMDMPTNTVAQGQPAKTHGATMQALPQPLCSTSLGTRGFDSQGPISTPRVRFRVPECSRYGSTAPWPNALRVVNGRSLDGAVLSNGISIVTNLPTYLVGDYNVENSVITSPTATPWVPSLVGGDKVIFLSNNWTDARSDWSSNPSGTARPASNTRYHTAILTEPSDTLTSLLENWTSRTLLQYGSMVYGYNAVYANHGNTCCGNQTYDPPDRTFNFDPHFGLITNQPPGTPVFPVSAISVWTKPK